MIFGRLAKANKDFLSARNFRLELVTEMLQGARIVKMLGYERGLFASIQKRREAELAKLRVIFNYINCVFTLINATPPIMGVATFLTLAGLMGHSIDAATGFTTLTLLENLRFVLMQAPNAATFLITGPRPRLLFFAFGVPGRGAAAATRGRSAAPPRRADDPRRRRHDSKTIHVAAATPGRSASPPRLKDDPRRRDPARSNTGYVSLQRVEAFLDAPDVDPSPINAAGIAKGSIEVDDADFRWGGEQDPEVDEANARGLTLSKLNLNVAPGELVVVCGVTGGGKSSVLAALLGEIRRLRGTVKVGGETAYCPQQAWCQNATLKENIVFGAKEIDDARYGRCLDACALREDIASFPAGDATEVGERGVTLSGGQQARVALARALYPLPRRNLPSRTTSLHGISASWPRRRRDPFPVDTRVTSHVLPGTRTRTSTCWTTRSRRWTRTSASTCLRTPFEASWWRAARR